MADDDIERPTPVDPTRLPLPSGATVPGSMAEGTRHIAKILLDQEATDLQRYCEVAVLDMTPGISMLEGEMTISSEQARHAVAATLATLAYFNKLPRGFLIA